MKYIPLKNLRIVVIFSAIFFLLILSNYVINLQILNSMICDQQTNTIKGASTRITKWIDQKIYSIEVIRDFITDIDHTKKPKEIRKILQQSTEVAKFANVYVGYPDNINISARDWIKPRDYTTVSRPWYTNTIRKNQTTITEPYMDVGLFKVVVSICTPLTKKSLKKGVVCGILPLDKIKNEILDIPLPYDGFAYIVDNNGRILIHPDSKKQLSMSMYKRPISKNLTIVNNELNDYIFSVDHIVSSNWFIIAQLKKSSVYHKIDQQLIVNISIYALSLIVFLILNLIYHNKQRKSDAKLVKTEVLLKQFIDYGDRGVLICDTEDKVVYHNSFLVNMLHLNKKDLDELKLTETTPIFNLIPYEVRCEIFEKIKIAKKTTIPGDIFFELKLFGVKKYIHTTVVPVFTKSSNYMGIIMFFRDVTVLRNEQIQKKEQEDIMFQQSKMADVGEMMGAISHQWKQPLNTLSIIVGNLLQLKKLDYLTDEIFEENLNHCMTNIHYLAKTIETFRQFYKPNKKTQKFKIDEAIDEVCYIVEPYFKNSGILINIQKDEKRVYECLNYKNEFQQIITTLLLNARDAILEDKKNEKKIDIILEFKEQKYFIKVNDYAKGIAYSMQKVLFTSFKTSKKDKGTGKGLYLSRIIARKKLLGDLKIENYSKPTSFILTLPNQREKTDD